jgi:hypothetical protein
MIARTARGAFALILLGSAVLLGTPAFAQEPEADAPARPEFPAPRNDRVLGSEGADSVFAADVVINEPATPLED